MHFFGRIIFTFSHGSFFSSFFRIPVGLLQHLAFYWLPDGVEPIMSQVVHVPSGIMAPDQNTANGLHLSDV